MKTSRCVTCLSVPLWGWCGAVTHGRRLVSAGHCSRAHFDRFCETERALGKRVRLAWEPRMGIDGGLGPIRQLTNPGCPIDACPVCEIECARMRVKYPGWLPARGHEPHWTRRLPPGITPADVERDLKPANVPGPGDRWHLGACVDGLTDAVLASEAVGAP